MKNFARKNGFTLIETIVAVAILSMAVAGPLTLATKNIGAAAVSSDQIIAFYLAQEATEYVRNKIDTNILNGKALEGEWLDGIKDCVDNENGCYVNINKGSGSIEGCLTSNCDEADSDAQLKFEDGYYVKASEHPDAVGTAFKRIIKIVNINADEAGVSATVSWTSKYGEKHFTMHDDIYNWRKLNE